MDTLLFIRYSIYRKNIYSLSIFNPKENLDITFWFEGREDKLIKENSMVIGFLMIIPFSIYIYNKSKSNTRIIFKIGYNPDTYIYKFYSGTNKKILQI